MILLDSCVLIAAFRRWEVHENISIEILESWEMLWITDFVLSETLTVIQMRESHQAMQKCYSYITIHPKISIIKTNSQLFDQVIDAMIATPSNLSFVDRLLILYHRNHQYKIATYDKETLKELKK